MELIGDVGETGGAAVFDGVLEGFELGVEAKAVVAEFNVEAAAFFDGEGDGAELVGDVLEGGIGSPDKGAGACAVGSRVGEGFVAGEGEAGLEAGAMGLKEVVSAGVVEEAGAEGIVELDRGGRRAREGRRRSSQKRGPAARRSVLRRFRRW